jgi:hypothetical protein
MTTHLQPHGWSAANTRISCAILLGCYKTPTTTIFAVVFLYIKYKGLSMKRLFIYFSMLVMPVAASALTEKQERLCMLYANREYALIAQEYQPAPNDRSQLLVKKYGSEYQLRKGLLNLFASFVLYTISIVHKV